MEELLRRIDTELKRLKLQRRIVITAQPHDNGHPNSHIKLEGVVPTFYLRQIVDQSVLRLLPDAIHLISEIEVEG